jgi:hypothetical protein
MDETRLNSMRRWAMEDCSETVVDLNDGAVQLCPSDRIVRVINTDAQASINVTLPPVGSCPWEMIFIYVGTASTGDCNVQDLDDGIHDFDMDANLLFSVTDSVLCWNVGGKYWLAIDIVVEAQI